VSTGNAGILDRNNGNAGILARNECEARKEPLKEFWFSSDVLHAFGVLAGKDARVPSVLHAFGVLAGKDARVPSVLHAFGVLAGKDARVPNNTVNNYCQHFLAKFSWHLF